MKIPKHIAIIPDGNRRWAKENKKLAKEGHEKGGYTLIDIVKAAKHMGVKVLTFYIFSTENWNRPKAEILAIFFLLKRFLIQQRPTMIKEGISFQTIGELSRFPKDVQKVIDETKQQTSHLNQVTLVLALNYGGKSDITRASKQIVEAVQKGHLDPEHITEELFSRYLDTRAWPDPDLLIRTSGEKRISNYLLWQISYAEVYFTDTLWPDFTPHHLQLAISDYQTRERRGGT